MFNLPVNAFTTVLVGHIFGSLFRLYRLALLNNKIDYFREIHFCGSIIDLLSLAWLEI